MDLALYRMGMGRTSRNIIKHDETFAGCFTASKDSLFRRMLSLLAWKPVAECRSCEAGGLTMEGQIIIVYFMHLFCFPFLLLHDCMNARCSLIGKSIAKIPCAFAAMLRSLLQPCSALLAPSPCKCRTIETSPAEILLLGFSSIQSQSSFAALQLWEPQRSGSRSSSLPSPPPDLPCPGS